MILPSEETIALASYGAVKYDCLLLIPDKDTWGRVTDARLNHCLPPWINIDSGKINEELFTKEVEKMLSIAYLPPSHFLERYAQERPAEKPTSFPDLNYLLVREIISVSPSGKVNPLVYKLSTAGTDRQVGLDTIKNIFYQELEKMMNPEERRYYTILYEQVLRTQQRFMEELPLLESVLQKEGSPGDISDLDISIFSRITKDGRAVEAPLFL